MSNIPPEIEKVMTTDMAIGETRRVCHVLDSSDIPCSMGKDEAAAVTRTQDGWTWFCHRCQEAGFKSAQYTSTKETLKEINQPKKIMKEMATCKLPHDAIAMHPHNLVKVPDRAWKWVASAGLTTRDAQDHNMQWSDYYTRIIIPIYRGEELIAWVGRCPITMNKDQRKINKRPKYLIRKTLGENRIYFIKNEDKDKRVIIVEDILSAIKVHKATGFTTVALLTTTADNNLARILRNRKVTVWLDYDALAQSMAIVTRFNSLGIKTGYIHTRLDPKNYSIDAIKYTIDGN